jgi:hypothetical protein
MLAQTVISITGVILLVVAYAYFAGFVQDTFPQKYKQQFELANVSEEDASTFLKTLCEDPIDIEAYNETLLKIVRKVQDKSIEDEAANNLELLTLGRICECVFGAWDYGDGTFDGDCTCTGTKTLSRVKISGNCPDETNEEEYTKLSIVI